MTPNLSTDELLMLAKRVYPEPEGSPYRWIADSAGFVSLVNSDNEPPLLAPSVKYKTFSPWLDGEDWQVAQACRVIVAAHPLIVQQTYDLVNDRQNERFDQRTATELPREFDQDFVRTMILDAVADFRKMLCKTLEPDLLTASARALLQGKV